ncbi:hypothetical protein ACB288_01030 [Aeromonas taiwanensis]
MARKTSVHKMDIATRMMFEEEVRRVGYGQSEYLVGWLLERGEKVSTQDVAQHALALKVADTACGRVDAVLAAASVPVGSQDALTALYRRLGELDYEREVILGMIRDRLAKQHDEGAH